MVSSSSYTLQSAIDVFCHAGMVLVGDTIQNSGVLISRFQVLLLVESVSQQNVSPLIFLLDIPLNKLMVASRSGLCLPCESR